MIHDEFYGSLGLDEDITEETRVHAYPPWREAINRFFERGWKRGDTIPHSWLWNAFSLVEPTDETPNRIAKKANLSYIANLVPFIEVLLSEHRVALKNDHAVGYLFVAPGEQTPWADTESSKGFKKLIRKTGARLFYVDHTALTDVQRRENADAIARLARRRAFIEQDVDRQARRQQQVDLV